MASPERIRRIMELDVDIKKQEALLLRLRTLRRQLGQEQCFTRFDVWFGKRIYKGGKTKVYELKLASADVRVAEDGTVTYYAPTYSLGGDERLPRITQKYGLQPPWRWWDGAAVAASEAADAAQTKLPLEEIGATDVNP